MLIRDDAAQARTQHGHAREEYESKMAAATLDILARGRLMEDTNLSPHNPARQLGRVMTAHDFETRIVPQFRIPNLLMEAHPKDAPGNPQRRIMYQIRNGEKHQVCIYQNVLPEWSILEARRDWVADPAFCGFGGTVAQRKDLPSDMPSPVTMAQADTLLKKHGFKGAIAELQKRDRPVDKRSLGFKEILVPGAEKLRGWRTVLAYMMQHELITPEQIRNTVGDGQRASATAALGEKTEEAFAGRI